MFRLLSLKHVVSWERKRHWYSTSYCTYQGSLMHASAFVHLSVISNACFHSEEWEFIQDLRAGAGFASCHFRRSLSAKLRPS